MKAPADPSDPRSAEASSTAIHESLEKKLAGEEGAVVVVPDLGEVADSRRARIRNEVESVKSAARRRRRGDFDRRGVLQEVSSELVCGIADLKRLGDSAPLHSQGVDDARHAGKRLREAVSDREGVEKWNVGGIQHGGAGPEMNIHAFLRNRN